MKRSLAGCWLSTLGALSLTACGSLPPADRVGMSTPVTPAPVESAAGAPAAPAEMATASPPAATSPVPPAAQPVATGGVSSVPLRAASAEPAREGGKALEAITAAAVGPRTVAMVTAPADLWERIRAGYAMPELDTDLVRVQERWYATRPDYIQRMTTRSRKYLFHIVEELELRKMPSELALLPFIESAFNPQAMSVARAAGMWQFIPSTGKHFELKQNLFRDDRRDVLASTRAALDYLQKLHGMFGDWHLALAAYNWGEGNVARAIARNQREGLGTGYLDLRMPEETRHYVPKLQAVKNLISRPEAFKIDIPVIENHPYFQTVTLKRDIDVPLAARLANVPIEDFKALNPSANRPVILAAGTPQILLPWDNATVFERNLEAHQSGQLATWTAWTVPATMTVAALAQKVGMSEADLRSINQIPPRMMVRSGSTVLVRRTQHHRHDVASELADSAQLNLAPEARRATRKPAAKAQAKGGKPAARKPATPTRTLPHKAKPPG